MEQASMSLPPDEIEFAADLAELGAQALRTKYKGEASSHAAMKRRCRNGNFEFDPAWDNFRDFLRDLSPRTSPDASLDRLDSSIHRYGPGLCRWATKTEQTVNRRNTVWVPFEGEQIRLQEFADRLGVPYSTVHAALQRGESAAKIAQRHAPTEAPIGGYTPAWIDGDKAANGWRVDYQRWLKSVRRDRRTSAPPEVFAIILASESLYASRRTLKRAGFDEMTPEEYETAREKWRRELRVTTDGVEWINHALRSLLQTDNKLAARLLPRHGEWEELRLFEKWLLHAPNSA